ncbi:hypothetical protein F5880DRAFT_857628 [Lentinula raphanica]|nr:hypothetical protein F5880DRAFT_857628 [Lentinula raphanica]
MDIPQEIFDLCIDWVEASHRPLPTLQSCALVCSSWLPRARTHLFRRLAIDFRFCIGEGTMLDLITQLRLQIFTNPSIVPRVRVLTIHLRYCVDNQPSDPESVYEMLPDIPFTHLQELHLNFGCAVFDTRSYPWRLLRLLCLLQRNPQLEYLSMRNFGIDTASMYDILVYLATYCTCLKTLALDDIRQFKWSSVQNDSKFGWKPLPRLISLQKLLLYDASSLRLMNFVFGHEFFDWSTLETLALVGSLDSSGIEAFVKSECGQNISFLTLDLRNSEWLVITLSDPGKKVTIGVLFDIPGSYMLDEILGSVTQLRKLQLLPPSIDDGGILQRTFEQLGRQTNLGQLASLYISNPLLVFPLDSHLVELTKAMPSLRHISFNFGGWLEEKVVDPVDMKNRLPLTSETGVLDSEIVHT